MASESTIDDIIKTVERFRILSVGRSGVGKSSLINCVFGITGAHVSHFKPGEADIQQEFVSQDNPFFVLHDSKGFEPGDVTTFETVREFIEQRSQQGLALKDRIHGLWYLYFSSIPPALLSPLSGSVQRRRRPGVVFSR
jgi:predicted GTPase